MEEECNGESLVVRWWRGYDLIFPSSYYPARAKGHYEEHKLSSNFRRTASEIYYIQKIGKVIFRIYF